MKLIFIKLSRTSDVTYGKLLAFIGNTKVFECSASEPLFEHTENPEGEYSLKVDWDNSQGKCKVADNGRFSLHIATPSRRPDPDTNYIYVVRRTCLDDKDAIYESACAFTLDSLIAAISPIEKCVLHIVDLAKGQ